MHRKAAQNIRLVVADVDGTLLNSQHQLTEVTRTTILALQRGGIPFTLATGKILHSIAGIVRQLELTQPLILSNGALIQRPDGTVLYEDPVPRQCLSPLISVLDEHHLDYALYTPTAIYVPHNTFNTMLVVEYDDPLPIETAHAEESGKNFCKLLILERNDLAKLERMESLLNERFGEVIQAKRSVPGMLEVIHANTSKAVAMQKVAAILGIGLDETMAIGDSFNDVDMFRVAGSAVAMGNAPRAVQEMADVTIGSNDEDGIGTYLSQLFPGIVNR